jgi:hypothetical protein
VDALASRVDEGRGRLRKVKGSCQHTLIAIGINVVRELESNFVSLDPLKTSDTGGLVVYTAFGNRSGVSLEK